MANYDGSLEAVDCHIHCVRYDIVLESNAGVRLRCLIRSPMMLQRRRYDPNELEPCQRCFYTIMANYNGSLEAVDCHIRSVKYDMARQLKSLRRPRWPHQVTYDVVATDMRPINA